MPIRFDGSNVIPARTEASSFNRPMLLLSKIARLRPRYVILDTKISLRDEPVIELVHEANEGPLVGRPSISALREMLASFGWTFECFDWKASGIAGRQKGRPLYDYWSGKRRPAQRLTALVSCHPEQSLRQSE